MTAAFEDLHNSHSVIVSPGPDNATGGTIILINKKVTAAVAAVSHTHVVLGRAHYVAMRFPDGEGELFVLNVHNHNLDDDTRRFIRRTITDAIARRHRCPRGRGIVIASGDWNCTTPACGTTCASTSGATSHRTPVAARDRRMVEPLIEVEQPDPTHGAARDTADGETEWRESHIDRFYSVADVLLPQVVARCTVVGQLHDDPTRRSDHRPVSARFATPAPTPAHLRPIPFWITTCRDFRELLHAKLAPLADADLAAPDRWRLAKQAIPWHDDATPGPPGACHLTSSPMPSRLTALTSADPQ